MRAIEVREVVLRELGTPPSSISPLTLTHSGNTIFEVELPDRSIIFRANEKAGTLAGTRHNIGILSELGLPVPRVLAADVSRSRYPFAYILLEKIPGRDLVYELAALTPGQAEKLAGEIVEFQRRVGALSPGSGYGYADIGGTARFASWREFVMAQRGPAPAEHDSPAVDLHRRLFAQACSLEPYWCGVLPTPFLDDLTTKNVLLLDGELQGVIDFDFICYGDPLWHLGMTGAAIASDVGLEALSYIEALLRQWQATPQQRRAATFYRAMITLEWLVAERNAHETAAWKARLAEAVRRAVEEMERTP